MAVNRKVPIRQTEQSGRVVLQRVVGPTLLKNNKKQITSEMFELRTVSGT